MSFQNMGLMPELLSAVNAQGYTTATPIQSQSIPKILEGRDVLAGAQTGTGKTAAFALPILQQLNNTRGNSRHPRALILTPTRELAAQILESFENYGERLRLRSTVIFGGVGINPQIDRLKRGVDILVATPGRLLDHAGQGTLDLSQLEILVLDEADRMLDMGFIHDIRRILRLVPEKRQTLMFSATYSDEIKNLADKFLSEPELIEVATRNTTADNVDQVVHPVARRRKREMLSQLITDGKWEQVLVFTRTKHGANRLAEQLNIDYITASAIHGNKSQAARTQALADFKNRKIRVLVATDIAARGLDINMLPYVVNYELPDTSENYVHRIGRTGRAGKEGKAISLVCPEEGKELQSIHRLLGDKIPVEKVPGFERILDSEISHTRRQRSPRNNNNNNNNSRKSQSAGRSDQNNYRKPEQSAQKPSGQKNTEKNEDRKPKKWDGRNRQRSEGRTHKGSEGRYSKKSYSGQKRRQSN